MSSPDTDKGHVFKRGKESEGVGVVFVDIEKSQLFPFEFSTDGDWVGQIHGVGRKTCKLGEDHKVLVVVPVLELFVDEMEVGNFALKGVSRFFIDPFVVYRSALKSSSVYILEPFFVMPALDRYFLITEKCQVAGFIRIMEGVEVGFDLFYFGKEVFSEDIPEGLVLENLIG